MKRTDIINSIIKKVGATSYLEIGVSDGSNFASIVCNKKVGVDPEPKSPATIHLPSDDFFNSNTDTFDVIFVDGLHHSDQVTRDIENSLAILTDGGYIICHDMNPIKEEHQVIPFTNGLWNGDCWKSLVQLRMQHDDLHIFTVDTDHGCSVITKGNQPKLVNELELNYKNFDKNRTEWLNLVTVKEFYEWVNNTNIETLLTQYAESPNNPDYNFLLARYYHSIGQTASAVSFYLRTAERTTDTLLQYECMIQSSRCFESQGTRKFTVKGLLQHAVALQPKRPEGYYFLSMFYDQENNDGKWLDSYTTSSIGLSVADFDNLEPLRSDIEYPGKYALLFQKGHAAWWSGLCDESKDIFMDLHSNYQMNDFFATLVYNNLVFMNAFVTEQIKNYTKTDHSKLKFTFENSQNVEQNYSEAYQDMFVLYLLNGKKNGSYLEIGAGDAHYGNNSYLLEKDFGWKGVSFDIDEGFVNKFLSQRSNPCILKDARFVDYEKYIAGLGFGNTVDYLQVDCDPPEVSFQVLLSIPFDKIKFGVITFEHDQYTDRSKNYRERARDYLKAYGYELVVSNVSPDDNRPYEDWYAHPDLVDIETIKSIQDTSDPTKNARTFMLKE